MKKDELNDTSGPSKVSGSAQLVTELQIYFETYAKDLKTLRERSGEVELLHDERTFDVVVKLLGVLDKIKKLDVVDGEHDGKTKDAPVRNLQDVILNGR